MRYENVLVLFGNCEYIARLLCHVEAYNRAAAKHDEIAPYVRTWQSQEAARTRRNGKRPKPGAVPMIPGIALHREDRVSQTLAEMTPQNIVQAKPMLDETLYTAEPKEGE